MKRHIQQPGVRQWAGEDLIELQAEPLKASTASSHNTAPVSYKAVKSQMTETEPTTSLLDCSHCPELT